MLSRIYKMGTINPIFRAQRMKSHKIFIKKSIYQFYPQSPVLFTHKVMDIHMYTYYDWIWWWNKWRTRHLLAKGSMSPCRHPLTNWATLLEPSIMWLLLPESKPRTCKRLRLLKSDPPRLLLCRTVQHMYIHVCVSTCLLLPICTL